MMIMMIMIIAACYVNPVSPHVGRYKPNCRWSADGPQMVICIYQNIYTYNRVIIYIYISAS